MITGTERYLLQLYDPTNEALRAPVGSSEGEALHTHQQTNKSSPTGSQEVLYKSASGRTGVITVVMDSSKYCDTIISKACAEFNSAHPALMSSSFQLPCTFDGITAGSWVFIEYPEETNGSNK